MIWRVPAKPSKYRSKATIVDGIWFPSKLEANRWSMLQILQRAGGIAELERQASYDLEVDGRLVTSIRWDFRYREKGQLCCDDAKGKPTPDWVIKAKLFCALHPEIEARINGLKVNFWGDDAEIQRAKDSAGDSAPRADSGYAGGRGRRDG